jgi:hypothetical protein
VNNAADRILALGQNKLAKSAVLIWLILSSIFSSIFMPAYTLHEKRQQAVREGLTTDPLLTVGFHKTDGICWVRNRNPRPLVHVDLRRYHYRIDKVHGCTTQYHNEFIINSVAYKSTLDPGQGLGEEVTTTTPSPHGALRGPLLIECEAIFHRNTDLHRFERVAFAGFTEDSQIEFPIISISSTPRLDGGSTYTLDIQDKWKPLVDCAHEQRRFRRSAEELFQGFFNAMGKVAQPK